MRHSRRTHGAQGQVLQAHWDPVHGRTASEEKRREIEDKYISRYRLNIKRDEVEELPEELSIEENKEDKEAAEEVRKIENHEGNYKI